MKNITLLFMLLAVPAFAQSGSVAINSDDLAGDIWTSKSFEPRMLMNPKGNFTIGNSDLAATDSKLFVEGKSTFHGDVKFEGKVEGLPEPKPIELPNTDWIWFGIKFMIAQILALAGACAWFIRKIANRAQREIEERIAEVTITLDEHERWVRLR